MADTENQEVIRTPENAENQQAQEPQYTEAEQRALAQGWVPKEQYQGTNRWRPAEEFLDRGELFAKIEQQGRRIQALDDTSIALKRHLETVRKTEYNRALATLREEKKAALNDGDHDAVVDIDEKILTLREEQKAADAPPAQMQVPNTPNPHFVQWVTRNSWYNTEKAMKIYADNIAQEMASKGMTPLEMLAEVERQTKKEFAHKFENPNRSKAGSVETDGRPGGQRKDNFQLTDEETRVMNRFVKAGVLTKEEYLADIKASRGA